MTQRHNKMWMGLIIAGLAFFLSHGPAAAVERTKCSEGKTATGKCVNPYLARAVRSQANILSQPKLSFTAPPVLPSGDRVYLNPDPFATRAQVGQRIPVPVTCAPTPVGTGPNVVFVTTCRSGGS
jgi:hypothetical protein